MPIQQLTKEEAELWLKEQELQYASAQGTGGVRIRMKFNPGLRSWKVELGTTLLYAGEDTARAVEVFNKHAY